MTEDKANCLLAAPSVATLTLQADAAATEQEGYFSSNTDVNFLYQGQRLMVIDALGIRLWRGGSFPNRLTVTPKAVVRNTAVGRMFFARTKLGGSDPPLCYLNLSLMDKDGYVIAGAVYQKKIWLGTACIDPGAVISWGGGDIQLGIFNDLARVTLIKVDLAPCNICYC